MNYFDEFRKKRTYLAFLVSDFDLPPFISNPAISTTDQAELELKSNKLRENSSESNENYLFLKKDRARVRASNERERGKRKREGRRCE